MKAAIDNDILYKGTCYGLLSEFIKTLAVDLCDVHVLGEAKYVLRSKFCRTTTNPKPEELLNYLETYLAQVEILEPSVEELQKAAELEYFAQRLNLDFDSGESQLCAIAILRGFSWLVTGDKRAIIVLERILDTHGIITTLAGKVICLEQIVARMIRMEPGTVIRKAICAEPTIDRSLSNCFSCSSPEVKPENWIEGLESYIKDLRANAATILAQ